MHPLGVSEPSLLCILIVRYLTLLDIRSERDLLCQTPLDTRGPDCFEERAGEFDERIHEYHR